MGKTAFMFPGQGTQSVGMLREICGKYPAAMETFKEADRVLQMSLSQLIFEGPIEKLNQTMYTQPAVLTAEIAAYRAMQCEKITPDLMVGFSLGEWAAVVAARMIPFDTALHLVQLRAQAMQEAVPLGQGGMAVIMGKTEEEVTALCQEIGDYVIPANFNYPGQVTVSGTAAAIEKLCQRGEEEGLVVTVLPISIPSHCALMEPAAQRVRKALEEVVFQPAEIPIILGANNEITTDPIRVKENMTQQLIMPIRFEQSVRKMFGLGYDTFLEIGPGKTLAGFVRKTAKKAEVKVWSNRTDTPEDLEAAIAPLGKGK